MNNQQFNLKSIEELVFLYSLDITLDIHKSQFEAFAKAMYEQGYFRLKTDNHSFVDQFLSDKKQLKIVPRKHIKFNRIIDARTIAKYQWGVFDLHPKLATKHWLGIDPAKIDLADLENRMLSGSGGLNPPQGWLKKVQNDLNNIAINSVMVNQPRRSGKSVDYHTWMAQMQDNFNLRNTQGNSIIGITTDDPIA